jgi:hypothetical protein
MEALRIMSEEWLCRKVILPLYSIKISSFRVSATFNDEHLSMIEHQDHTRVNVIGQ